MIKIHTIGFFAVALASAQAAGAQDRFVFEGGVGAGLPSGTASSHLNPGFSFMLGGGWKFTPQVMGLLEYGYVRSSLTDSALSAAGQLDGYNRYWSLTINPRYYLRKTGRWNGYVTGGYGLYSRRLAFTDPSQAVPICDPFYGFCDSSGAPIVAEFTNYNGGVNAGGGLTYALGESGFKVFADARYHRFLSHINDEFVTISIGLSR